MLSHNIPDLYIVGAPKCGTTSIMNWLSFNDSVYVPENKEPRYFCDFDLPVKGPGSELFMDGWIRALDDYSGLYSGSRPGQILCDASVAYLSNKGAAERIHKANPNAKILIVLRNPVDRAYSEHCHLVRDALEEVDFETALELEGKRMAANWRPLFYHVRRSMYYKDICHYLDVFHKDHVLIVLFDDLIGAPEKIYTEICRFIGVNPNVVDFTAKKNASGRPRSKMFQKFIKSRQLKIVAKRILGKKMSRKIFVNIQKANITANPVLSSKTRHELMAIFKDDIRNTSELINKDLSHWIE